MDALKSAGRALIRSPSLAKQSWGGGGRHRSECAPLGRGSGPRGPASRGSRGEKRDLTCGPARLCPALPGLGVARGRVGVLLRCRSVQPKRRGRRWEERPELGVLRCGRQSARAVVGGETGATPGTSPPRRPGELGEVGGLRVGAPGRGRGRRGLGRGPHPHNPVPEPRGRRRRAPTCVLPAVQPPRSSFDSRGPRNRLRCGPEFAGTYLKLGAELRQESLGTAHSGPSRPPALLS